MLNAAWWAVRAELPAVATSAFSQDRRTGAQKAGASAIVSTLRLISWRQERYHTGRPALRKRPKARNPVAAARRRQELAKTAAAQRRRRSSPCSLSTKASSDRACARPSPLSGESRKSESAQSNIASSRKNANKTRGI